MKDEPRANSPQSARKNKRGATPRPIEGSKGEKTTFKRIDHIAFTVKDRHKSIRFYGEHFGFRVYFEHDVPVPAVEKIVYLKLGDTVLEMIHMPNSAMGQGFHFCLESDSFDEDYSRLKNAGIDVLTEPHPAGAREPGEESWRRAVFAGPDGEQIEIRG